MYLLEIRNNVDSIWKVGYELMFVSGSNLTNVQGVKLHFKENSNFFYSDKFLYSVKSNEILVFNNSFDFQRKIKIKDPVNISFYETIDNYLIRHGKNENLYSLFLNDNLIKEEENIIGVFLNSKFRLHFKFRFKPISYFRCSDLQDEHTYWEYDCGDGYVTNRFYMWKGKLVFSKSKDTDVQLVLIDLPTGKIDWKVKIANGAFFFHEKNAVLVSVWGSKREGGQYQIIHLDKQLVVTGRLEDFSMEYVRVNWETQFLANNKYYFTETVYTTGNQTPRPIKFGCFDIETKTIDFLQEVPQAEGGQFAQVLYHDNKLYLRTSANELFIFEEESDTI